MGLMIVISSVRDMQRGSWTCWRRDQGDRIDLVSEDRLFGLDTG